MADYSIYTNEELVELISDGEESAYAQLFLNLRPIILYQAQKYRGRMDTYSMEDLIQEAYIVAWQIISRGNYNTGKGAFSTYYSRSIADRFYNIYRDYTLKNFICIEETEEIRGNITRVLVEADFVKEYRVKKAEQQRRWREKKKAQEPPKEKKPPMTKEERSRKIMEYQRKYYAEHPDKLAERREKNRIAEARRRAARKAAKKIAAIA